MPIALSKLADRRFDVLVIGAGINGASSAQHLAAAGYSVLLVDKADFASGSSGRSTRMLHGGLRYFETPRPLRDFALNPRRLFTALGMARASMRTRAELAEDSAQRLKPYTLCFPIYEDGPYKPWHLDIGLRLLDRLGQRKVPVDYRRVPADEARHMPLVECLGSLDKLRSVATFREYMFDWPERFCIDAALDAERLGAVVRTYTTATLRRREPAGYWRAELMDSLDSAVEPVTVSARVVLNMAGIWIDAVNELGAGHPASGGTVATRPRRLILGTKGAHIVVKLPEAYRDFGIAAVNSLGEPHYCLPSQGGYHHIGPTETVYEGDIDDVRVDRSDMTFLLDETSYALPGLSLGERDIVYTWAGVRPLTHDPAHPKGNRSRRIHDLSKQGLPNVYAMTAGPIMSHRSAGRAMAATVRKTIAPSRKPSPPDYAPRMLPENTNSPPVIPEDDSVRFAHLAHVAATEHGLRLADLLFARTGVGYRHQLSEVEIRKAAEALSVHLGWDEAEISRQIGETLDRIKTLYSVPR